MIGSQKSSRIDSLKDQYGRVVYNRHDLYEMLYNQEDIEPVKSVEWHEDFEKYNTAIQSNYLNLPFSNKIDETGILVGKTPTAITSAMIFVLLTQDGLSVNKKTLSNEHKISVVTLNKIVNIIKDHSDILGLDDF